MNTPLHLFIGCSPIAHKPHASENRTESSKKNTMQRVATENFAKTCNILKKRRNVSLCELTEELFFKVEKARIVRIDKMHAMGFEIRPFYAFPVPLFFIGLHAPQFPLKGLDVLLPVQYIAL